MRIDDFDRSRLSCKQGHKIVLFIVIDLHSQLCLDRRIRIHLVMLTRTQHRPITLPHNRPPQRRHLISSMNNLKTISSIPRSPHSHTSANSKLTSQTTTTTSPSFAGLKYRTFSPLDTPPVIQYPARLMGASASVVASSKIVAAAPPWRLPSRLVK